jgi:hypothetical protein
MASCDCYYVLLLVFLQVSRLLTLRFLLFCISVNS